MPDSILVIEYEPKYTDRVRQALAGQPLTVAVARDGDEALRAIEAGLPGLVVLSTVVPKGHPAEIIRAIRSRSATTPILLTVSGYTGTSPAQDAVRYGVTDILPKPYSEPDFLGKVQQMLGLPVQPGLTSGDIFGDIVDERPPAAAAPRKAMTAGDEIDKMLADSLAGRMPKRSVTSPGNTPKPKSAEDVDKILQDTLSGLEKRRHTRPDVPAPAPAPPPQVPDRVPVAQPVFHQEAATPLSEGPEPVDGVRFGQYVLLEKIATGGMAEVWKARKSGEEGFEKIVAIKKILPHLSDNQEFIEMFIDEAKLAAQLNHNNIIHIYDLGKIGTSYYIAMEYVDGFDLKTILKRGQDRDQPLGVDLSLFIASRLASALDFAHRKRDSNQEEMGLVHRDVSPQNVLISKDGDVKLCDFGIAKAASKASHTQAGALKGKLQYMSPEQASGKSIDRRSDIFAVAAVLFEMLAGRKLFTGDSEMSILEQVREGRVTPPSQWNDEVTPEIDAIVARGLQKEPQGRYETAGEMAREIERVLYTLRPTPTSADLAIYMHRLSAAETVMPVREVPPAPAPDAPKVVPVVPAPAPVVAPPPAVRAATSPGAAAVPMPSWESHPVALTRPAKKRSAAAPLVIVALLIAAGAGAFFYLRSRPSTTLAPAAQASDAAGVPESSTTPAETGTLIPVPTETTNTNPPALTGSVALAPALDPALVDQEVQRLLAAERARLEREALATQRRQQEAAAAPPVTRAPEPQPVVTRTEPPPVAPQPESTAPAETTTTIAESPSPPPPPTDTAPAAPRFREGDLVPQGTEGLTPARVIRLGTVPYPAMARVQRAEGTVILNVLVSETGAVLEIRMIRGINRPLGLNEAAQQVIRRSTFAAPMLRDGTRVKSWTTVPVKFEL